MYGLGWSNVTWSLLTGLGSRPTICLRPKIDKEKMLQRVFTGYRGFLVQGCKKVVNKYKYRFRFYVRYFLQALGLNHKGLTVFNNLVLPFGAWGLGFEFR